MSNHYSFQSIYFDDPIVPGRVLDIFEPAKNIPRKESSLFFVHGGGWRSGSRDKFHQIMEKYTTLGYTVCSTDYRLNAKDAFEQIRDVRDGYMIFADYLKAANHPVKIFIYGESAGAHLASLVLCSPLEARKDWITPAGGILHATPHDFLPWDGIMESFWNIMQGVAGVPYDKNPEVYEKLSFKNYINETNPPLFFIEAGLEHLFMPHFNLETAKKHRSMGIKSFWKIYPMVEHGFFHELKRSRSQEAFTDIALFIDGKSTITLPENISCR